MWNTHKIWHGHRVQFFSFSFLFQTNKQKKQKQSDRRKTQNKTKKNSLNNLIFLSVPLLPPIQNEAVSILFTRPTKSCNPFFFMTVYIFAKPKTLSFLFQVHLYEACRCLMAKLLNYFLDRSLRVMLFRASLNVK